MSVGRLTNKFDVDKATDFTIITGAKHEQFILSDLQVVNDEQLIWHYLKEKGYTQIWFYSPGIGLYFLDKDSALLPKAISRGNSSPVLKNSGFKRQYYSSPDRQNNINSHSENNENAAVKYTQQGYRYEAIGHDNENFATTVRTIFYNKDNSEKRAMIFIDSDQAFQSAPQEREKIWDVICNMFSNAHRLRNFTSHIKYFFLYQDVVEEQIVHHINYLAKILKPLIDNSGNAIKSEHIVHLGYPEEDEIMSLINRYRLLREYSVDWQQLDSLIYSINNSKKPVKLNTLINCFEGTATSKVSRIDNSILKFLEIPLVKRVANPLDTLNSLIGLKNVKKQVKRHLKLFKKYKDEGRELEGFSLHMVFEGNPGTGKTTVARLVAQIYAEHGLLKKGQLIEVDRADLVGQYVGETAQKTRAVCEQALGGVLFIDEAYSLADKNPDHGNDFGEEAINTLTKFMEDNKDDMMVIAAGYSEEMDEFIKSNPGLQRRFSYRVHFEDYIPDELMAILKLKLKKLNLPEIDKQLEKRIQNLFKTLYKQRNKGFENAGLADNIANGILEKRNERIEGLNQEDAPIVLLDLPTQYLRYIDPTLMQHQLDEALEKLNELIGLSEVKTEVNRLCEALKARSNIDNLGYDNLPISDELRFNMIFYGNPGTGKTEVAKILGEHVFKAMGISNGKFYNAERKDFVAEHVGGTATKTAKLVERVKGGVLFIDEVYSLQKDENDIYGKEAVDTLVKLSSELKDQLTIIIAGYTAEVQSFLENNPGLKSRFAKPIQFKNYSLEELLQLSAFFAEKRNYIIDEKLKDKLNAIFNQELKGSGRDFGNARFVENLIKEIMTIQKTRLQLEYFNQGVVPSKNVICTLTEEDLPHKYKNIRVRDKGKAKPTSNNPFDELDNYVGMQSIKKQLQSLVYTIKWNHKKGLPSRPHIVFKGSPGTGKTVVAKQLGSIFREEGVLKSGHLISPKKEDIIRNNEPEENIKALIRQAKQGVLFLDEAYALATDIQVAAAVTSLLQYMENERGDLIVIMAGYEHEINELYKLNPGLKDRIGTEVIFKDYSPDELWEIFEKNLIDQELKLEEGLDKRIESSIRDMHRHRDRNFANARTMENFLEEIKKLYIARVMRNNLSDEPIRLCDIPEEFRPIEKSNEQLNNALSELDNMIGLGSVKNELRELVNQIRADQIRIEKGLTLNTRKPSLFYIFVGNPGTGKTTVARLFGKILNSIGVLNSGEVIEVGKSHLEGQYVGHTAPKTRELVESAFGKVLFIDEAYRITEGSKDNNNFGKEVIGELVQCMTEPRVAENTCIIAAGYTNEMNEFLASNPGLKSRFSKVIEFEDYSNEELVEIFKKKIAKQGYIVETGFYGSLLAYFESITRDRNFGNGRTVDNLIEQVLRNLNSRLSEINFQVEDDKDLMTLLIDDLPIINNNRHVNVGTYRQINQINNLIVSNSTPVDFKPSNLKQAVGYIEAEGSGSGTGFVINKEGYVLTCQHVVENASTIKVYLNNSTVPIAAECVYTDKTIDLAILKLNSKEEDQFEYFALISEDEVIEELTPIALRGYPLGRTMGDEPGIWNGTVNGTSENEECKFIKNNIDATHGASGAPVFRISDGKVIGFLSSGVANEYTKAASYNLAVDIRQIYSLKDLDIIISDQSSDDKKH